MVIFSSLVLWEREERLGGEQRWKRSKEERPRNDKVRSWNGKTGLKE